MSALTSSASAIALPAKAAAPSVSAQGVPSLAAFVDLMADKLSPPTTGTSADDERQDDAGSGKSLPETGDNAKDDPSLDWLIGPIAVPLPELVEVALPPVAAGGPGADVLLPDAAALKILPAALSDRPDGPAIGPIAPSPSQPGVETLDAQPIVAVDLPNSDPQADAPIPVKQPAVERTPIVNQPQPSIAEQRAPLVAPPPAQSAGVVLPALFALSPLAERTPTEREDTATPLAPLTSLSHPTGLAAVAPTADAQRQQLDMGQRDWPQRMIDRIEALRDDANARDTSIRLKPEALGRVDVALKAHADGAVSVRFMAEQPATRALLVDAVPQLAAAAEARGIRLSGTSVDLSGQGSDPRPRPEVERRQPTANRLAATGEDITEAVADGRIA